MINSITVTILILVETLLQPGDTCVVFMRRTVTILILVETLLQQLGNKQYKEQLESHNPYFSGNSFATFKK